MSAAVPNRMVPEKIDGTKEFLCHENCLTDLPGAFERLWPGRSCFLVADENTYAVCGEKTAALLKSAGIPRAGEKIFPGTPELHGDYRHCQTLAPLLREAGAVPIVIGSGTLNDIVKRAAFDAGAAYGVIATAASVDGYAADGAALLENGAKHTMACPAPALIIADPAVLSTAPPEMTAAGYGDLMAKYPAGADWLLAAAAGIEPVDPYGWSLVHSSLDQWTGDPRGTASGDTGALMNLFEGLSSAGFAMQYMKQSRPVSGAEHLISHILEMENYRYNGRPVSHGFQVAAASGVCIKLMHHLIGPGSPGPAEWRRARDLYTGAEDRVQLLGTLFPFLDNLDFLSDVNREKTPNKEAFFRHLETLENAWPELKAAWKNYLPREDEFLEKLAAAGCPGGSALIGLAPGEFRRAFIKAQYLRNRYTILDLLAELGYFEDEEKLPLELFS